MPDRDPPSLWLPLAGAGLQLATTTIAGLVIGAILDRWLIGGGQTATVAALVAGFVLGMVRFVRQATGVTRRVAEFHSAGVSASRRSASRRSATRRSATRRQQGDSSRPTAMSPASQPTDRDEMPG